MIYFLTANAGSKTSSQTVENMYTIPFITFSELFLLFGYYKRLCQSMEQFVCQL